MIEAQYRARYPRLILAALAIEQQLRGYLDGVPRVDRVSARAKSVDRFVAKANKLTDGSPKYSDPLSQIQDQIGARIIGFYLSDIEAISSLIEKYFRPIESKLLVPESEWEFGYFGKHFILLMPTEFAEDVAGEEPLPEFFELQIKTLFQHAWSEAEHDVGYKPSATPLSSDEKRQLAFTAAQAWGADRIFDELCKR
jgi:putative GTP pyrophosphokinase